MIKFKKIYYLAHRKEELFMPSIVTHHLLAKEVYQNLTQEMQKKN